MRRHDRHISPDVDDERDITQQFWGSAPGWNDRAHPPSTPRDDGPRQRRDDTTGAIRAIRDGFAAFRPRTSSHASGPIDRTREHGIPRIDHRAIDGEVAFRDAAAPVAHHAAVEHQYAEPDMVDRYDPDMVSLAPARPRASRVGLDAVDPLLLRFGVFVLALVVLFPLAWTMRSANQGTVATGPGAEPAAAPSTTGLGGVPAAAPRSDSEPEPASSRAVPQAADPRPGAAPAAPDASASGAAAPAVADLPESRRTTHQGQTQAQTNAATAPTTTTTTTAGTLGGAATAGSVAERVEPECEHTYIAQPGDSWYRIAEAAGITPTALLSANRASLDTTILPGDEICLPPGSTVPTTTTTTTSTTAPPTTTAPTTTTAPASAAEVQQIIRDVWPDHLEEKALEVAYRESRYQPRAYNGWCCYGVFQIYWTVHQSWLDDYDIHTAEDLYDPRKNTEAAYALYQAAGGWSPWSQTAG